MSRGSKADIQIVFFCCRVVVGPCEALHYHLATTDHDLIRRLQALLAHHCKLGRHMLSFSINYSKTA